MYPEQTPYVAPSSAPSNRRSLKVVLLLIAIVVLAGASVFGGYAWRGTVAEQEQKASEARIATLEESLAKATKNTPAEPEVPAEILKPFVVKELDFQFTPDEALNGLTYAYNKTTKTATFSTSAMLTALTNVKAGKGKQWLIGDVVIIARDSKAAIDKAPCGDEVCLKESVLATVGDDYIYQVAPASSPGGTAGFEAYDAVINTQPELLQTALKTAKPLES